MKVVIFPFKFLIDNSEGSDLNFYYCPYLYFSLKFLQFFLTIPSFFYYCDSSVLYIRIWVFLWAPITWPAPTIHTWKEISSQVRHRQIGEEFFAFLMNSFPVSNKIVLSCIILYIWWWRELSIEYSLYLMNAPSQFSRITFYFTDSYFMCIYIFSDTYLICCPVVGVWNWTVGTGMARNLLYITVSP